MIDYWKMFCVIISTIRICVILTFFPIYFHFIFCFPIFQPIIPHIPCLTFALLHIVMDKIMSSRVVRFQWSRRLNMTKGMQDPSKSDYLSTIIKQSCCLCFGSRTNNMSETSTFNVNWMLGRWEMRRNGSIFEIKSASNARSCFRSN